MKIKFEFTNEFGDTYTQESNFMSYSEYENDIDLMGRLLNNFLRQIGFPRNGDYIFMEDLTEEELEAVQDFITEYRSEKQQKNAKECVDLKLVHSGGGDWHTLYINNKLKSEGHEITHGDFLYHLGNIYPIVWHDYFIPQNVAEKGMPENFNDIKWEEDTNE